MKTVNSSVKVRLLWNCDFYVSYSHVYWLDIPILILNSVLLIINYLFFLQKSGQKKEKAAVDAVFFRYVGLYSPIYQLHVLV